jgi:RNA polymerase sigma-54 factor
MMTIAHKQRDFFLSDGDDAQLKPMILEDVANEIGMDISTVSRAVNSKYVECPFGIYELKFFFSSSITTDSGDEVSNKEVKKVLKEIIDNEDKSKPYSDEKLEKLMKDRGYDIARRTIAKYREQLGIPVARLRKEL